MKYKTTNKITKERIQEILRIKKQNGLTAENVIKEAKKKKNVLHQLFDWNNTEAAEKWRLHQARVFINEIKIIIDTKEYYAFENVSINISSTTKDDTVREYKETLEITNNNDWRQQIIKTAYSQLLYWKNKYEQYNLTEFLPIMKEIEKISPKIKMEV